MQLQEAFEATKVCDVSGLGDCHSLTNFDGLSSEGPVDAGVGPVFAFYPYLTTVFEAKCDDVADESGTVRHVGLSSWARVGSQSTPQMRGLRHDGRWLK